MANFHTSLEREITKAKKQKQKKKRVQKHCSIIEDAVTAIKKQ